MQDYMQIIGKKTDGTEVFLGLMKEDERINICKDLSPEQLAIINQKSELKKYCGELGGHIHMYYVKIELLFNDFNLNRATITRLIFLATYIDYNDREENVLVKHGKDNKLEYITRKDLRKLLNVSDDTVRLFLKEVKEKELLFEANGKYYLSNKIFSKGKCSFNKKEYARVFIGTTRTLYDSTKASQHKQLSYIFQLVPFLHFDSNVLCKNPDELNKENIIKLSLRDICEILRFKMSKNTMNKLERKLLNFHIKFDGKEYYLFKRVIVKGKNNTSKDFFVIIPVVIWKGSNLQISKEMLEFLVFDE